MKSFFRYLYSNKNKNNNNFSISTKYINRNSNNNNISNSNNNHNNNNNNNSILETKKNIYINSNNNNSTINNNNNINIYSNINNIKWSTIINIERLDIINSNIMFLVTFLEDQNQNHFNQVIIKTSITIAQELYASVLEANLNYPINNCRLIEFSQDEFIEMSTALLSFSKPNNKSLYQLLKKEIEKSFFIVIEIQQNGKRFNELNHKKYFSGKNGKKKLLQLGQVIAFEIFCNNFCRPPISWDENTFFSNLLFFNKPNQSGWYFSIVHSNLTQKDSLFSRGYRDQINRLKLLLFSIFQNPNSESEEILRMREFLRVMHIHLPSSCFIYIQRGIVIGVKLLVSNISFTMLESTKSQIKNLVHTDTQNNLWRNSINSIHYCPFLLDVLNDFLLDLSNFREKKIKINLIL